MRPYFDVHCHIGITVSRDPVVGQSIGRYLARMASAGVAGAIISPTPGGPQARGVLETRDQNEVISKGCRLYPERFPIGLAIVEVRHERVGVEELERAMEEGGLLGFMCHPGASGNPLGGELHPFLEAVAMRKGLCLLHQAGTTAKIAAYGRRFPDITFIIGHVSMNKEGHYDAIEHCAPCENILFDIAQKPEGADPSWDLAHLVDNLGGERIMFGSDAPYYNFRLVQAQIESANIDEKTKDLIAYQNAVTLIQRFRPDWELPMEDIVLPQIYTDEEMWAARGARLL